MRILKSVFAILALVCLSSPAIAATKAIRFGKLWDGNGKVITNAVVIVENERILRVGGSDTVIPPGAEVIDLRRFTAIPGMIDAHTHMTYYWNRAPGTSPRRQGGPRHVAVTVFLAQDNAKRTLETGVTTIRDLNASGGSDFAMRDLINMGAMVGPRMLVSGQGVSRQRNQQATPGAAPVDPAKAAAETTKMRIDAGADWVKVFGSTGGFENVSGDQTVSYEEMKAIVDTARAMGKPIAIHSYGPAGARDAVRAGADTLEHATDIDDETIAEMARKGIWYVPTIDHNQYYVENAEVYGFAPGSKENLTGYINRNFETAKKAFKAGVKFVMGSDAVYNGFGLNTRELSWYVKLGMTPEQALQTATKNGAAMLKMQDSLGALAPNYFADIVAVEGDPLSDINVVLTKVRWVMRNGNVVVDKTK